VDFAARRVLGSILFTDIRYFNKIANILPLEEIHAFLNDCYKPVVDTVLEYEGNVDKFIGDAVMAFFGSPRQHDDDPLRAVKCALDIQKRIEDINIKWGGSFDFLVEMDIGICTGEVLAGNVGHIKKLQCTVIGKPVNLAAQLVHMCRDHNVEILVDKQTYQKTKNELTYREVGEKLIMGFVEPVRLYSPSKDMLS
jgi:adenylate cyclase